MERREKYQANQAECQRLNGIGPISVGWNTFGKYRYHMDEWGQGRLTNTENNKEVFFDMDEHLLTEKMKEVE